VIVVGFDAPDKDNIRVTINGRVADRQGPDKRRSACGIIGGSMNDSITIDSSQEIFDIRAFIEGGGRAERPDSAAATRTTTSMGGNGQRPA